jgi:2-amino-4-hydroxy-6-hydroxymethyldihydropteridine diphosphokinase
LDPFQLLGTLNAIQRRAGRIVDEIRFGPRVLDMDIILYDDLVIHSAELIIPHPRMHKRHFVLKPICDIDPGIIHPILKKNMQYLLNSLNDNGQGVEPYL